MTNLSEAQRPTSGPSGTLGDQPEHAPIDLGAPQGNTAPMRDGVITPVSTPHDVVTARSSAEKFDDELGATTGRTISQVPGRNGHPGCGDSRWGVPDTALWIQCLRVGSAVAIERHRLIIGTAMAIETVRPAIAEPIPLSQACGAVFR